MRRELFMYISYRTQKAMQDERVAGSLRNAELRRLVRAESSRVGQREQGARQPVRMLGLDSIIRRARAIIPGA